MSKILKMWVVYTADGKTNSWHCYSYKKAADRTANAINFANGEDAPCTVKEVYVVPVDDVEECPPEAAVEFFDHVLAFKKPGMNNE